MNMNMDTTGSNDYGAGDVGSSSTGAEGSSRPSSPASLSDNRVDAVVDHQATALGMPTGEEVSGAGTMSAPASVSGRRGRGVRAAASGSSSASRAPISDDDESDDSEASTSTVSAAWVYCDAVGPGAANEATTGRKRGRPLTTGVYVGLAEAKKRLLELKRQELELYDEAAVVDPTVPPPRVSQSCKPLRDEARVAAEMWHAPTPDLVAVIAEKVAVVEKVAGTSKHLKGTYVHSLREAALLIRHAAAEQAKRTVASEREVEFEREVRHLCARLEATEALSRARDDGLAAGATGAPTLDPVAVPQPPPTGPPSPPGSRRSRRASARAAAGVAQVEPAPPPAPLSPPRVEGEAFSGVPGELPAAERPPARAEIKRVVERHVERLFAAFEARFMACLDGLGVGAVREGSRRAAPRPSSAAPPARSRSRPSVADSGTRAADAGGAVAGKRCKRKRGGRKRRKKPRAPAAEGQPPPPPPPARQAPPPRQKPAEGDPPPDEGHASCSQVVGRKERKRKAAAAAAPAPPKAAVVKTQQAAPSSSKRDGPSSPTRAEAGSHCPYGGPRQQDPVRRSDAAGCCRGAPSGDLKITIKADAAAAVAPSVDAMVASQ
ncbi:PREDICTED: tropomyosin-1, isoforms 33/34-like [Dufourea novaeangliae]|uniref:tropomyosin-1, isoforms 33/34-like n=1 Tax=Dufourea novaeangliae TaxID=178035 RepID=UPI0007670EE0|nr:PREDICTED: tropomyosin-1, isoforms 33/34-like [Dufourea novaeangliae]